MLFFILAVLPSFISIGELVVNRERVASVPTRQNHEKVLNPKALDCFIVSIGLLVCGLFVLIKVQLISLALPFVISNYGLLVIAGIFILRAIGEFRYVGFYGTTTYPSPSFRASVMMVIMITTYYHLTQIHKKTLRNPEFRHQNFLTWHSLSLLIIT